MEHKSGDEKSKPTAVRKACFRPFVEWTVPSAEEVRIAMKLADLTGSGLAALVGVQNSRTIRRWTGGDVEIPYAAWAILSHKAGFGIIWE